MAERNLLLGKGEALATAKEIKRNSGPKNTRTRLRRSVPRFPHP